MKKRQILPESSISYVYGNGYILGLKAEQAASKLRTTPRTGQLGFRPRDNCHVTH